MIVCPDELFWLGRQWVWGEEMKRKTEYDAVVVGSGPNGLASAIHLASSGQRVLVVEAHARTGGGMRTEELTLPGFKHDVCSAVHPTALASAFFRQLPLDRFGLRWLEPQVQVGHPFDDRPAALIHRSVAQTARGLGPDSKRYEALFQPLVDRSEHLFDGALRPVISVPRHPVSMGRLGLLGSAPATHLARLWFRGERARGAFGGIAGHSMLRLDRPMSASFGLLLGVMAHAVGWPVAEGGSESIARALESYLRELGGEIVTGTSVSSLRELPAARIYMLNTSPAAAARIVGDAMPAGFARRLNRYRHGFGVCKVDYAIEGDIPWRDPALADAGTIHLGGTLEEMRASEREVATGRHPERPYVLLAQQSSVDPTRAPRGHNTVWAYCHVPNGSTVDHRRAIDQQIERFAPGFRERVLGARVTTAAQFEQYNPNYVGGDINGGAATLRQLVGRPVLGRPFATPVPGVYLCSAATPPGGGVHGMAGYLAAQRALRDLGEAPSWKENHS